MRKTLLTSAGVLFAVLLVAGPARALHRQTPIQFAITNLPGGFSEKPSTQGALSRFQVFESTSDLLATGSSGREVFMYDLAPPRSLAQVTNFANGDSANPSADAYGQTVAFDSSSNIFNLGGTARQIYTWSRRYGTYQQITFGNADSTTPTIDYNADRIVFLSQADLLGEGATGTNVYIWNAKAICGIDGCFRMFRLTNGIGASGGVTFSRDPSSSYVLFHSNQALSGPSNGFNQVYLYDRRLGVLSKLTNGLGDSTNASISSDGRVVSFQSTADLLGNGSSGREIFLLDLETSILTQVTNSPVGESFDPSLSTDARWIAFSSTSDLLGSGSLGQQLFIFDHSANLFYQVTKSPLGDAGHAVATNENLFFFDSTQDYTRTGLTGRQIYVFNIFRALGSPQIGSHKFNFDPLFSQITLTTRDGIVTAPVPNGSIGFNIGSRDFDGEAPVRLPQANVKMSPIEVPGFGAVCLDATADGGGILDCDGGHPNGNITVTVDHATDDSDPMCLLGCREGSPCEGELTGPHQLPCPFCRVADGICVGGVNNGQPCANDDACAPHSQCSGGTLGVCNGPLNTQFTGNLDPGGLQVTIPLTVRLVTDPGLDRVYCTGDDSPQPVRNVSAILRMTTGTSTAGMTDADDIVATSLAVSGLGAPFDCNKIAAGFSTGGRLCGALTMLDVPNVPGLRDVILSLCAQEPCNGPSCPIACNTGADCDDGNPCNGTETCTSGRCRNGSPIQCTDFNSCNGIESCNPGTGLCDGPVSPPPNCDDGNSCTDDSCDPFLGCLHDNNAGPCDDSSLCTLGDTCQNGLCVGSPVSCPDPDLCDGVNTCDPLTGLCLPTPPPNCDDANPCTTDSCNPGTGCQHVNNNNACSDADACTTGDVCSGGACTGTPTTCNDNNVCNGVETCDIGTGFCIAGTALNCDDSDTCSSDTCDSIAGCIHNPASGFSGAFCYLDLLGTIIGTADDNLIQGKRQPLRLAGIIARARQSLEKAQANTGSLRNTLLRITNRKLVNFSRRVQQGDHRIKINHALAVRLLELASRAQLSLPAPTP